MSDPATLAAVVIGGILLVVMVIHLTGATTRARLTSAGEVVEVWALDDATPVRDVQLADDHTAALLTLDDGSYGVMFSLGDGWVSRRVPPTARVKERHELLLLRLGDFTAPRVRLPLANANLRADWAQRLES